MTRSIAAAALLALHLALPVAWTAVPSTAQAAAQTEPATSKEKQVWDDAGKAALPGPAELKLLDKAVLKLPQGRVFIPQPQAAKLLQAMGNPGEDPHLQGLIFPQGDDQGWFMTVRYEASGHIKDDDAKAWNADELLDNYKQGTEAANEERAEQGMPALEIVGWAEKPAYDAAAHRLVWAMSSREKGAAADAPQGVNYNTYLLGREGFFKLNLVTGLADLSAHKPEGQAMLAALNFNDGQRYEDFDEKTDHLAEYGLAALVLGVGAKKLGLLATAGLFLAKFAKLIFFGGMALLAGIGKLVSRRRNKALI